MGRLAGLRDPDLIEAQGDCRNEPFAIESPPTRQKMRTFGPAWDKIAHSFDAARQIDRPAQFLEGGAAFDSRLFIIARTIVRLVEEDAKPNAERLREYGDAGRASLERALYSPAPIYPEYEQAKLARSLAFWRQTMGESDPDRRAHPRRSHARKGGPQKWCADQG